MSVVADDVRRFLLLRIARIYPVHLATMAAMLVLYAGAMFVLNRTPQNASVFSLPAILANLTMTHAWFNIPSPNVPAWTISAEWFAYILYPVVCFGFMRLPQATKLAAIPLALMAVHLWGDVHPLLRIAPEFLIGMCLRDAVYVTARWLGVAAVGAIVLVGWLVAGEALALRVTLFGLLIVGLASPHDWLRQLLSARLLLYAGEISYSLYLVHGVVLTIITNLVRAIPSLPPVTGVPIVTAGVLVSFMSAVVMFEMVEKPARRWIRKVFVGVKSNS